MNGPRGEGPPRAADHKRNDRRLPGPLRSSISWSLLGLVIDRPSYAYELAQRFDRTYEDALSLSSTSHVYTALAALEDRALIEELPGTRDLRQPKPRYQATALGIDSYRGWLVEQVHEDRRRQRLFVLQLGALVRREDAVRDVLDRYEQAVIEESGDLSVPEARDELGPAAVWVAGLLAEESRLVTGAKLALVRYARRTLRDLVRSQSRMS
jgi:DNA-binding PadR family transcriptional regulator